MTSQKSSGLAQGRWAKLTMMAEAVIWLLVAILVVSSAVNILR